MENYLPKEKIQEVFKTYGGKENNTGSPEGQVALFTLRINHLTEHLKQNKKDHVTRRSLLRLVGKRKRLLTYIANKDINNYRQLIEKLGLRK